MVAQVGHRGSSISTAEVDNGTTDNNNNNSDDVLPSTSTQNEEDHAARESMPDSELEFDSGKAPDRFEVGQFILTEFSSQRGKKTYKYMCKILEVVPEIVVLGMKSIGKTKRKFKFIADDIFVIRREDVIKIQANPSEHIDSDGNSFYEFETDIEVREV